MALNSASQLGSMIGGLSSQQDNIMDNMTGDDESQDQLFSTDELVVEGTIVLNKLTYPTDSFILDHPVYGDIDSSVLKIDGGYIEGAKFNLTFPISFEGAEEVIFTKSF